MQLFAPAFLAAIIFSGLECGYEAQLPRNARRIRPFLSVLFYLFCGC